MTKRTPIPSGLTVPAPCPGCGGRLGWHGATRWLRCDGGDLAVDFTPDEARDMAWRLAVPGMYDTPLAAWLLEVLTAHHLAVVPAVAEPQVISTKPTPATHKARILPVPGETPAQRAERLAEQARLNDIDVTPIRWTGAGVPVVFLVESGERDEHNQPVRTYEVEVSSHRAYCPCKCSNLCSHLLAVKDWLLDWEERERTREPERVAPVAGKRTPAVQHAGTAAYNALFGG